MPTADICGHRLAASELPRGVLPVTCERSTWGDKDSCVWHAESEEKQESDLPDTDSITGERIDGAVLRKMTISESTSFEGCMLFNSDFRHSNLQSIDFSNSDIRNADFTDANLNHAIFTDGVNADNAIFTNTDLKDAKFNDSRFTNVDFNNSNGLSVNFKDARLMESEFQSADLRDADFRHANLRSADFTDAKLRNAKMCDANLERTDLSGSDLREANITGMKSHECDLRDVRLDHRTELDRINYYEREADINARSKIDFESRIKSIYNCFPAWTRQFLLRNPHIPIGNPDSENLEKAVLVYRDFQRICHENSLPEARRTFSIREKHSKRKLAYTEGNGFSWFKTALSHRGMLYGESPWYVIRTSIAVVIVFSIFYSMTGVRDLNNQIVYSIVPQFTFSWDAALSLLQFSMARFLTASDGGFVPIGIGSLIATVESAIGAFLIALFVFVLGRRATQ